MPDMTSIVICSVESPPILSVTGPRTNFPSICKEEDRGRGKGLGNEVEWVGLVREGYEKQGIERMREKRRERDGERQLIGIIAKRDKISQDTTIQDK